jgi:dienelactone hydrolase
MNSIMPKKHSMGLLVMLGLSLVSFAESPPALPTPPEVWKDFNPDQGDFNEKIVKEETKDGIYFRDSYISAYVVGEEIRVYCKYAVKAGVTKAPGLMDVHGWMSSANPDLSFVRDGWAVMAHDYCGKTGDRPDYTKYPEKLNYGNMDAKVGTRVKSQAPDGQQFTDPKQTNDYLWYAIQRRVLSYLLVQKEVDKTRIGAKGYSYGGTLMWNLGMDPRVKAVVAYFGIGWLDYYRNKQVWMYNVPYVEPKKSPDEELILSAIAPEAHAPYIRAACLWLNGTNDHHGGHERGEQTFKKFQPGVPWSFAHQARAHHNTEKLGQDGKLWLEKYVLGKNIFWPERPKAGIKLSSDGVPELHVTPASPAQVKELQVFYALKNPVSFVRTWRDAAAVRQGDTWSAKLPVINVDDYVFSFANITYDSNGSVIVLSSDFQAAIPSKLGKAVATDKASDVISEGTGQWSDVGPVEGVGGVRGFRVLNNQQGTTSEQFSDPKWKAPQDACLSFRFYCTQPQTLTLVANGQYEVDLEITASEEWQSMVVKAATLINKFHKQPLPDWSNITSVQIKPKAGMDITKVVFAQFKWVVPDERQP